MDKKSKLQRIVSMRNSNEIDEDDTAPLLSSKLSKIITSNNTNTPLNCTTSTASAAMNPSFSTQHDILKYSHTTSHQHQSKQLGITKRHLTSSLNNINIESEKISSSSYQSTSVNTSLSRKVVSSSAATNTNSKEDINSDLKTNSIKPVRKIAVVNGSISTAATTKSI